MNTLVNKWNAMSSRRRAGIATGVFALVIAGMSYLPPFFATGVMVLLFLAVVYSGFDLVFHILDMKRKWKEEDERNSRND
jgi:hypothetical protein